MSTTLITHPSSKLHEMSATHPECPNRLWSINDALISQRLMDLLIPLEAVAATRAQLLAAHSEDYIDHVFEIAPSSGVVCLDADTWMNKHSLNAALYAAGGACLAVDKVMLGETTNAFCAMRPPGHHAERNRAMGFCIFNNIAIAACHALHTYSLNRIAIVDFDVHHGNGTEQIFSKEPRVMFCSSFEHPCFPYISAENEDNHLLNMPLSPGTKGDKFREVISDQCLPALEQFKPELLLISAGFDAHVADPLASLLLVEDDFAWITQQLVALANRHCQGHLVSTLEGGYDLNALGRSVAAHVNELLSA